VLNVDMRYGILKSIVIKQPWEMHYGTDLLLSPLYFLLHFCEFCLFTFIHDILLSESFIIITVRGLDVRFSAVSFGVSEIRLLMRVLGVSFHVSSIDLELPLKNIHDLLTKSSQI